MNVNKRLDVTLVLACYNEEPIIDSSVASIVETLSSTRYSYEIIFVDDKSSDKTVEHIKKLCRKYPHCRALFHAKNEGRGKTVTDGIRSAHGIVTGYIDIDLEVSAMYMPSMIRMILDGKADIVLGKRIYRTSLFSLHREFFSVGYQKVADWMVGTGGLDTETGYKFFDRKKILPVLEKCEHPHWFWDTESMVYAKRAGLRIIEVPVLFLRRFDKISSVRIVEDIKDYIISLWQFRRKLASQ